MYANEPPIRKRKKSLREGQKLNDRSKVTRHLIPYDQDVDDVMLELLPMLSFSRNRKYGELTVAASLMLFSR